MEQGARLNGGKNQSPIADRQDSGEQAQSSTSGQEGEQSPGPSVTSAEEESTAQMLERILDATREQLHRAGEAEKQRAKEAEEGLRQARIAEQAAVLASGSGEPGMSAVASPDPRLGDESILRVRGIVGDQVVLHAGGVMDEHEWVWVNVTRNKNVRRRVSMTGEPEEMARMLAMAKTADGAGALADEESSAAAAGEEKSDEEDPAEVLRREAEEA